jgi:hypothetical protein
MKKQDHILDHMQNNNNLFLDVNKYIIYIEMSIPEFIIMAIIRKMLIDGKPKISFKEIKK